MINTPLCSAACRLSEKTRQAQAQMVINHFSHDWYRYRPARTLLKLRTNPTSRQWLIGASYPVWPRAASGYANTEPTVILRNSRRRMPALCTEPSFRGTCVVLVLRVEERLHLLQCKFAILVGVHCPENSFVSRLKLLQ